LQTAGVNFQELWKLDIVKHSQLQSNDVWAIRCAYGVEAARASIMEQIMSVFGAYGIEVDPRHLSLIADFMTFDGGFRPMSRIGMENSSSTFLQMSFETTTHFLKNSALIRAKDDIMSPSANIVVGRPVKHGTGSFMLMAKG
jgi:DNA-directed RNA polymerase I subunit RPA1